MFNQFHCFVSLLQNFSSYFVTLIPNVISPSQFCDFIPISMVGSLYKLVARVLDSRIEKVMDKLISPNQSKFLKGKMLVYNTVVINEVVDLVKRSKKSYLILMVNFETLNDSTSKSFLNYRLI